MNNGIKLTINFLLLAFTIVMFAANSVAQDQSSAGQTAEELRAKLIETQAKEAELKSRAQQLDEDLKPENIERALAGIGSTKPEELREQRRRQLTIERESVGRQLELLATSRERLQTAILEAENRAYQQSAQGAMAPLNGVRAFFFPDSPWLAVGLVLLLGVAVIVLVIVVRKLVI